MEDPKSKKTGRQGPGAAGHGVGVPAKGDSSASSPNVDPLEGATISDAPAATPPGPAKRPTRVVNPDATLAGSLSGMSTPSRAFSNIYLKQELLQPGDVIGGRYEILQLLGEGGMGAVYKALDREVERTVALKLISENFNLVVPALDQKRKAAGLEDSPSAAGVVRSSGATPTG